ncbi:unnamed protein product [Gordionus sp. m RMFG-2023]
MTNYMEDYCKKKKIVHPYLTGERYINLNECLIECTVMQGTMESFPTYPLPNGVICNTQKTKYCLWRDCVNIPQTPDLLFPRLGDISDLVDIGVTRDRKYDVRSSPSSFPNKGSMINTNTNKISHFKITKKPSSNHEYEYYEDTASETDENIFSASNSKSKAPRQKISKENNDTLNTLYLLVGIILSVTIMASVIGYLLYKKRLRESGNSIRFSNQDLIPDNNYESREGTYSNYESNSNYYSNYR